jgi:hypothetical protein
MKARIRLFKYFLLIGYSFPAAWDEADRQAHFSRRMRR